MFTSITRRPIKCFGLIVLTLASCMMPATDTHAAGGTLQFHATVSGKAHDTGGFSTNVHPSPAKQPLLALLFVGCAVVTQKFSSGPATYQLQVRTDGTFMSGMKPTAPGVNLTIDNFHPNARSSTYSGSDVGGTFGINGHAYGDGSRVLKSKALVTNGGLTGTWTDTAAVRDYPAPGINPTAGFQFHATWHCTTLFHVKMK